MRTGSAWSSPVRPARLTWCLRSSPGCDSALLVSNDTGTAHLAAAVAARSVVVFQPGDPRRWAHPGARHAALVPDVACAPCPPWSALSTSGARRMTGRRRLSFVADSETWGGAEVYLTHLARYAVALGWDPALVAAEPVAPPLSRRFPDARTIRVPLTRHRREAPETAATLHLGGNTDAGPGRAVLSDVYGALSALLSPARWIRDQAQHDLGVPRERTHVLPNGVRVPADPHGPSGADPLRIGVHGRLTEQKGLDVLVEGTRLLVERGVPLEVVIGGVGRDRAALERSACGLPVRFTGFVPDARAFLRDLDVFCLSSRREALPLSLLEAMSEGLPCVATDVGDVRRVLGDAVLVVPPENPVRLAQAVRALVEDHGYRTRLGELARRRAVERLDASLMARRTYDVLASVVAGQLGARLHSA